MAGSDIDKYFVRLKRAYDGSTELLKEYHGKIKGSNYRFRYNKLQREFRYYTDKIIGRVNMEYVTYEFRAVEKGKVEASKYTIFLPREWTLEKVYVYLRIKEPNLQIDKGSLNLRYNSGIIKTGEIFTSH